MYVAAPIGDRVVEGYVDLLVRAPDGLVIVDYKTDRLDTVAAVDARAEEYRLQLAVYAAAIEAVTGEPVARGVLVFAGSLGAVERAFERSELGVEDVPALLAGAG
jgi:ATP-dependent helicase/nuclease subunit A